MVEPFDTPLFFRLARSKIFLIVVATVWTLSVLGFCYLGQGSLVPGSKFSKSQSSPPSSR